MGVWGATRGGQLSCYCETQGNCTAAADVCTQHAAALDGESDTHILWSQAHCGSPLKELYQREDALCLQKTSGTF